ncbi:MAG: ferredoxin-thioredoxin reductase catalytic domain-containing protein [Acidobacteriota bacterium]
MKRYWRCFVCNDIHFGVKPPEICPTCLAVNAYVEISSEEAEKIMHPAQTTMTRAEFREAIEKFTEKNEFQVNPDRDKLEMLLDGVFENEKNHGLKYCPCRLRTKDFAEDLKLVCPCNFIIHETYRGKADGECWCGLFVRRKP